jgi:uncharacterized protein YcbK (DUF882 family)
MIRFTDAAKHYQELPHQIAAWEYLEQNTDTDTLLEFQSIYRSAVPDKADQVGNDWVGISNAAAKAGAKFPELVAAQWALESGFGKHVPANTNNYFGLKGTGSSHVTKEFLNGRWHTVTDSFLHFPSLQACVDHLVSHWYKDFKGYSGVNNASTITEAAFWLVKEKYATDPTYAQKLLELIQQHGPKRQAEPFSPNSPFDFKITPNITYGELTLQSEARRFTKQHQCDTALLLCQFVQKARDHFKRPAIITSGHRPPKINAEVGGASRSEHLYDAPDTGAVDFYLDGMSVLELQHWADDNWPYSLGYGAPKGFIHVGLRPSRPRIRWDY